VRVIDGDTIDVKLSFFGPWEVCRIAGLDCDEIKSKDAKKAKKAQSQKTQLESFFGKWIFKPWIFRTYQKARGGGRRVKRCGRGRAIVVVYVWRWFRYVKYSEWMVENGYVKKGSKWNE